MLHAGEGDPVGTPSPNLPGELTARFERDAVPLHDRLFRGALRLTNSRQDAEDLVQETMLLAYRGFHTFEEGTNLNAWMFQIMHNAGISRHRKTQRRPAEVLVGDFAAPTLTKQSPRLGRGLRSAEVSALEHLPDEEIKSALMGLREEYRLTIYLADVEGLPYKEIARVTGVAAGTVMSRVHRGRQQLRSALSSVARRRRIIDDLGADDRQRACG
ncbi:sigma-70 family RNA polymerase sigma factor [Mycolicibacterium sp. 050232]|uniref:sigma-70 family RNA polymerase sigma factor n=1 Tax=Mycolicibacterium sp. 050232 TaxID=3113982 RepID=UPI002E2D55D8|nr:sigma-70 family RNA polymerase sigma factor [Mycolicibacterium sp. 050232]MED5812211.1 sigma-70 family RNA polymerase sigma factor [Mycolicibacterium sp. 050232]